MPDIKFCARRRQPCRNAIAAPRLLHLGDKTGKIPHVYFGWSEGNPAKYLFRYTLFGEGDTAPVTGEILR